MNMTWLPYESDKSILNRVITESYWYILIFKNTYIFSESMKCQLICLSKQSGDIFVSKENLLDGTTCSYDTDTDICVQVRFKISPFCMIIHVLFMLG